MLTEADQQAWRSYVEAVSKPSATDSVRPAPPQPQPKPITPKPAAAPIEVGISPGGIDRATWTRFRAGKMRAERTLDLHGHTLQRAHAELHAFLARALADRIRCVEIVTGRGSRDTPGVIRREFPLWLNSPALRPLILAASHPHQANPGSVRVLLRKQPV